MVAVTKVILDVLKPHQPNALEFSRAIAGVGPGYVVSLTVIEVDEKTESLEIELSADAIDFDAVEKIIQDLGGSVHSIDHVEVRSPQEPPDNS